MSSTKSHRLDQCSLTERTTRQNVCRLHRNSKETFKQYGLCLDRRSCCRFTCDGLFCARENVHNSSEMENVGKRLTFRELQIGRVLFDDFHWCVRHFYCCFVRRILNSKALILLLFTKYSRQLSRFLYAVCK